MILRIFVPEFIYRCKFIADSKCYQLFGKVATDNDGDNVSVFIVDIRESSSKGTPVEEIIGTISNDTNHIQLPSDHITFGVNGIGSVLQLKSIHLPNFISCGATVQTQLFLYDSNIFSDLSQRIENQQQCERTDPISQLLVLIKHKNEIILQKRDKNIVGHDKSIRCRIISFLISLSAISQSKLSFLNSSFLRHFHFWTTNLDKLTGKRQDIH